MRISGITWLACLVLGAVKAAPLDTDSVSGGSHPSRSYNNAERIARGLGVNRPARLFDPSRSLNAPHAKRSSLPNGVPTGNIAFTSPTLSRKRAATVSYATVVNGQFGLSPNPNDAALFGLPDFSNGNLMSGAFWIPANDIEEFIAQQAYAMFATLLNGIANLGFGNPPPDAFTNLFAPSSYFGGLLPRLPTDTSPSQQYIWVTDTEGNLHLAADLATARERFGSVQPLVPVAFQPGSIPDFTEAITGAAEALINPTRLWGTDWYLGQKGYIQLDGSGGLTLARGDATTFYVPNLNSDSLPVKLISQVDGEIVTISGTQGDLETISSTVGAGVDNLRLSLPRGQNVIVDLEIADTPYYLILVDRETGELYSANGNGFGGSTKKDRVCMEFVAFDAEPQHCQSFIEGLNDLTYGIRPTNVYVSTSSGNVEGYLNTESDGTYSIGQSGGRFFDGSNNQGLFSKVGINYLPMSAPVVPGNGGIGPLRGVLPTVDTTTPNAFVRLDDPVASIIRPPPNIGGDYTVNLKFYVEPTSSAIYAFNGPQAAAAFSPSLEELCIERFADGGEPSLCEQQWSGVRNSINLWASQVAPGSSPIQGWISRTPDGMGITPKQIDAAVIQFSKESGSGNTLYAVDANANATPLVVMTGMRSGSNIAMGQPMFYNTTGGGWDSTWLTTTGRVGSIVSATPSYNLGQEVWLWNYIPGQIVYILPNVGNATALNPSFVEICIETVALGGTPLGVCQQ